LQFFPQLPFHSDHHVWMVTHGPQNPEHQRDPRCFPLLPLLYCLQVDSRV
jgi:hypothetical protein